MPLKLVWRTPQDTAFTLKAGDDLITPPTISFIDYTFEYHAFQIYFMIIYNSPSTVFIFDCLPIASYVLLSHQ